MDGGRRERERRALLEDLRVMHASGMREVANLPCPMRRPEEWERLWRDWPSQWKALVRRFEDRVGARQAAEAANPGDAEGGVPVRGLEVHQLKEEPDPTVKEGKGGQQAAPSDEEPLRARGAATTLPPGNVYFEGN